MYLTHVFLTSTLAGCEWSTAHPGLVSTGNEAGWGQDWSGQREEKGLAPTGTGTQSRRLVRISPFAVPTALSMHWVRYRCGTNARVHQGFVLKSTQLSAVRW